jgi:hypothetical protein
MLDLPWRRFFRDQATLVPNLKCRIFRKQAGKVLRASRQRLQSGLQFLGFWPILALLTIDPQLSISHSRNLDNGFVTPNNCCQPLRPVCEAIRLRKQLRCIGKKSRFSIFGRSTNPYFL